VVDWCTSSEQSKTQPTPTTATQLEYQNQLSSSHSAWHDNEVEDRKIHGEVRHLNSCTRIPCEWCDDVREEAAEIDGEVEGHEVRCHFSLITLYELISTKR
jgi:hypothetical protein